MSTGNDGEVAYVLYGGLGQLLSYASLLSEGGIRKERCHRWFATNITSQLDLTLLEKMTSELSATTDASIKRARSTSPDTPVTKRSRTEDLDLGWEMTRGLFRSDEGMLVENMFAGVNGSNLARLSRERMLAVTVAFYKHSGPNELSTSEGVIAYLDRLFGCRLSHLGMFIPLSNGGAVYLARGSVDALDRLSPTSILVSSTHAVLSVLRLEVKPTHVPISFVIERIPPTTTIADINSAFLELPWVMSVEQCVALRVSNTGTDFAVVRVVLDEHQLARTINSEAYSVVKEARVHRRFNKYFEVVAPGATLSVRARGYCISCGLGHHGPNVIECRVRNLALGRRTPTGPTVFVMDHETDSRIAEEKTLGEVKVEVKEEQVEVTVPKADNVKLASKPVVKAAKSSGKAKEVPGTQASSSSTATTTDPLDLQQLSREELIQRLTNTHAPAAPSRKARKSKKAKATASTSGSQA